MKRTSSRSSTSRWERGSARPDVPLVPWLDLETAADVADITQSVAAAHPEVQAVILFGSVARHDERPLDDTQPSDVDLLLIIDPTIVNPGAERLTHQQELDLHSTIGEADYRHRTAPREVKPIFMNRDLARWDEMFIENVARDGILLWARARLPEALASVATRTLDSLSSPSPH